MCVGIYVRVCVCALWFCYVFMPASSIAVNVCVCLCVSERERERESECVCVFVRVCVRVCVSVRARNDFITSLCPPSVSLSKCVFWMYVGSCRTCMCVCLYVCVCACVCCGFVRSEFFPQRVCMRFLMYMGGVCVCSRARECILWVLMFVGVMCVCALWVLCVCVHTHITPTNYMGVMCVSEGVVCGCWCLWVLCVCVRCGCYVCVYTHT